MTFFLKFIIVCTYMTCALVGMSMDTPEHMCGGRRKTLGSWFSLSTVCSQDRIQARSSSIFATEQITNSYLKEFFGIHIILPIFLKTKQI